jgi:hypothetical protein
VPVDGIDRVELAGDPERLRAWVGDEDVPLYVDGDGAPRVRGVRVRVTGGGGLVL